MTNMPLSGPLKSPLLSSQEFLIRWSRVRISPDPPALLSLALRGFFIFYRANSGLTFPIKIQLPTLTYSDDNPSGYGDIANAEFSSKVATKTFKQIAQERLLKAKD